MFWDILTGILGLSLSIGAGLVLTYVLTILKFAFSGWR